MFGLQTLGIQPLYRRTQEPCPPNPEQTASLISLVTYAFLDPTILLANRIPHLSADQLPPIADYDQAKNLVKKSFPTLDPFTGGNKHLFWGIVSVFRKITPFAASHGFID